MGEHSENSNPDAEENRSADQALRRSADRVRSAIRRGTKPTSSTELDVITENFGEIMERLNRLSPNAHARAIRTVFRNNRSTLSKFTNPLAKDRRTKLSSYLHKVETVGKCVRDMVDYPTDKMVVDLVRGTAFVGEIEHSTSSSVDCALDDLWNTLLDTAAYIDRQTGLYEKFAFLKDQSFDIFDTDGELEIVPYGEGDDVDEEYVFNRVWDLMLRIPICYCGESDDFPAQIYYVPEEDVVDLRFSKPNKKQAKMYSSVVSIYENISLILRPDYTEQRLTIAVEPTYDTHHIAVSFVDDREIPKTIPFVKWDHRPIRNSNEEPYSTGVVREEFVGQNVIVWAELQGFENDESYVGSPMVEDLVDGAKHHFINRYDLDAWNYIDVQAADFIFDDNWTSHMPTELSKHSLAHLLEYLFIDTADPERAFAEWFITPRLLQDARELAARIDTFKDNIFVDKKRARERLTRIFDGEEPLD